MAVTFIIREGTSETTLLTLDATASEAHGFEQEVTLHPVEEGADAADHLRAKPRALQLEGVVSNRPIATPAEIEARGLNVPLSKAGAVRNAYDALLSLEGRLCDVVTELERYRDMALTRLDIPRTPQTGAVLRFNATMIQVRRVRTETVKLGTKNGAAKAKLGQQPTKTAPEKYQSILKVFDVETLGGFLDRLGR